MFYPHLFYHVAMMGDYRNIFIEQMDFIQNNLTCEYQLHACCLGDISEFEWVKQNTYRHTDYVHIGCDISAYEFPTLSYMHTICSKLADKTPILYLHTKGASKHNRRKRNDRRFAMEMCVNKLELIKGAIDNYEVISPKWEDNSMFGKKELSETLHGVPFRNFFWTNSDYIKILGDIYNFPNQDTKNRYNAERYVGSNINNIKCFDLNDNKEYIYKKAGVTMDNLLDTLGIKYNTDKSTMEGG